MLSQAWAHWREASDKENLDTVGFGHALLRGLLQKHPIDFGPEVSNRITREFPLFSWPLFADLAGA